MNEVKNNSPKRPVIFYYAIVLVVLLALNFLLVPWMSERSVKETGYNEFLSQVSAGNVTEVEVQEQNAVIYYKVNVNGREEICKTGTMNDPELVMQTVLILSFTILTEPVIEISNIRMPQTIPFC